MVNDSVEATFKDDLMCALADLDDKKKQDMHIQMENVVINV